MATKLFKAMKKLHGNFRWCLTGTPVQNSLEDLAALISFIRSSPLDDFHTFRKHVIKPLLKGSENGVENLRLLLDSLCLRRTKELLNLPEAAYDVRLLNFSAKEEQHYIQTRDKLIKMIHQNRMQPKSKSSYLGVFQLQLQLRRLCNHGSFQKLSLGAEEFDPEQAIAHLKQQKSAKCEACGTNISGIHGIEETQSGNFTTCGHLLCMKCIPNLKLALGTVDGQDDKFQCSLCKKFVSAEYIVADDTTSAKASKSGTKHLSAWQYFDRGGCSTKVSAVVEDIEKHKTEGKR
jgi:SNF2 family DNA or RNA helicase